MLSRAIYQCINLNTKIAYFIATIPFQWDPVQKELRFTRSKLKMFQWYFVMLYLSSNCAFMAIRAIQAACCMNISVVIIFMNLFNVFTWFTACTFHLNSIQHRREIVNFVNQLMRTGDLFERKKASNKAYALHIEYFEFSIFLKLGQMTPATASKGSCAKNSKKSKFRYFKFLREMCRTIRNRSSYKTENTDSIEAGSSVKKFSTFCYFYSGCQLLASIQTLDTNPKYYYTQLFDLKGVARWKLLPIGILECYMSYCVGVKFLFYILVYLSYVKITRSCLDLLR